MNKIEKIPELEAFRDNTDKYESLFTVLVHDMTVKDLNDTLYHKLNLIKTIKNAYKRKYLNDRLFSFIEHFKEYKLDHVINRIFLVGPKIEEFPISNNHIKIIKDYNIENFIFKYGDKFDLDYLASLLNDLSFKTIIRVNNTKMEHLILNTTKRKVIYTEDSKELNIPLYIQEKIRNSNDNNRCLICGISGSIKNLKLDDHFVINKHLTDEEIFKIFQDHEQTLLHDKLKEVMSYISNEKMMDRVVFGKDLEKGIKNYMIKEIYCTPKMYEKINTFPKAYLNFEIIQLKSLEEGDIVDTLDKNYKGIIGLTYF